MTKRAFVDSLSKKYGPPIQYASGERRVGWKRRPVTGSLTVPHHFVGVFMNCRIVRSLEKR